MYFKSVNKKMGFDNLNSNGREDLENPSQQIIRDGKGSVVAIISGRVPGQDAETDKIVRNEVQIATASPSNPSGDSISIKPRQNTLEQQ